MIRIIRTHVLALATAMFAVGCAVQGPGSSETGQSDDEVRSAHLVGISNGEGSSDEGDGVGNIPAASAHPTARLGPSPDPWNGDGHGPSPDPWNPGGRPAPAPAPSPSEPGSDKK